MLVTLAGLVCVAAITQASSGAPTAARGSSIFIPAKRSSSLVLASSKLMLLLSMMWQLLSMAFKVSETSTFQMLNHHRWRQSLSSLWVVARSLHLQILPRRAPPLLVARQFRSLRA